jgi:hypothetical protein
LAIDKPKPVAVKVLLTSVVPFVLTCMPALEVTKDKGAPVKLTAKVEPEPPSTVDNPAPVVMYLDDPKALVACVIKKGYVDRLEVAWMAPVVVCTVTPF